MKNFMATYCIPSMGARRGWLWSGRGSADSWEGRGDGRKRRVIDTPESERALRGQIRRAREMQLSESSADIMKERRLLIQDLSDDLSRRRERRG